MSLRGKLVHITKKPCMCLWCPSRRLRATGRPSWWRLLRPTRDSRATVGSWRGPEQTWHENKGAGCGL